MIGMYWSSSGAKAANRSPIVSMLPPIEASPPSSSESAIVISSATTNSATSHTSWRYLRRQYHSRRREMTSWSRSWASAPYSDGAGISLWASTSISPRKAATPSSVKTSAQPSGQS